MSQPLILRDQDTKLISVNFDPQLTAILREVGYLKSSDVNQIPESAMNLFNQNDTLWKYITNLDLIVHLYNKVRNNVLEVELPLIESQLEVLDVQLEKAETIICWESEGIIKYQMLDNIFNVLSVIVFSFHLTEGHYQFQQADLDTEN